MMALEDEAMATALVEAVVEMERFSSRRVQINIVICKHLALPTEIIL